MHDAENQHERTTSECWFLASGDPTECDGRNARFVASVVYDVILGSLKLRVEGSA